MAIGQWDMSKTQKTFFSLLDPKLQAQYIQSLIMITQLKK